MTRLRRWLGITAGGSSVYSGIVATTDIASLSYWLGIFFSAGIATFGLVESSPAVIIGAKGFGPGSPRHGCAEPARQPGIA